MLLSVPPLRSSIVHLLRVVAFLPTRVVRLSWWSETTHLFATFPLTDRVQQVQVQQLACKRDFTDSKVWWHDPNSRVKKQQRQPTPLTSVWRLKCFFFFFFLGRVNMHYEHRRNPYLQRHTLWCKCYISDALRSALFIHFHAEWVWEEITKVPNSNQDCKLQRWRTPAETATRDTSFISKSSPMSVPHRTHKATVQDSLLVNTQSVQTAHRVQSRSSRSGRGDKHAATFRGFKEWKATERTLPSWWKF